MVQQIKLEFYQTDDKVFISFFEKIANENDLQVISEPKLLQVIVNGLLVLNTTLYKEIIPEETSYLIKTKKIEITLKKQESNHWSTLEDQNSENKKEIKYFDKWEKIVKEIEKDDDEIADYLYDLLYKNSDDDGRRAMMKSLIESDGKVLNMNWDVVKSKKVVYEKNDD